MNNDIIIYVLHDEHNSITHVVSSIFLKDTEGYEEIDRYHDIMLLSDEQVDLRYVYAHADNGEYVKLIHGNTLFDEKGRPNYHGDWVEWTEEEKEQYYPLPTLQPTEQEMINAQLIKEIALLKVGANNG